MDLWMLVWMLFCTGSFFWLQDSNMCCNDYGEEKKRCFFFVVPARSKVATLKKGRRLVSKDLPVGTCGTCSTCRRITFRRCRAEPVHVQNRDFSRKSEKHSSCLIYPKKCNWPNHVQSQIHSALKKNQIKITKNYSINVASVRGPHQCLLSCRHPDHRRKKMLLIILQKQMTVIFPKSFSKLREPRVIE